MRYILDKQNIPLHCGWDVIVVGGGPAGVAAAVAARKEGLSVLIIEASGCLGGMATSGLVPAWCPFTDGERFIYGGFAKKVYEMTKATLPHVASDALHGWQPLNPEALKRIYDEIVEETGVKVLFYSQFVLADTENGDRVKCIIVANKAGLSAYQADYFIDCSGDGDLCARAGAEYLVGDENTGAVQPATLCFILSNCDSYTFINGYDTTKTGDWLYDGGTIFKILNLKKYHHIKSAHLCGNLIGPGTVGFNAGHIFNVDATDPESLSRAAIEGRKIAKDFSEALAEVLPKTYANSYLVATANSVGIRESRRICGEYYLTAEDYFERRSFEDEIARNCYHIDIHQSNSGNENITYESYMQYIQQREVYKGKHRAYKKGESHGIPYRCLIPKKLKNVLMAGRCISCDHTVQGSIRIMPVCLTTGEAAGTAVGIAKHAGCHDMRDINIKLLQQKLVNAGGYLPNFRK